MLTGRRLPILVPSLLLIPATGLEARATTSLQLVLAVDASGSVNMPRFALQRDGYATAFRDPAVQSAIGNTATGSIAVMLLQWTGPAMQTIAIDWTLINGAAAAEEFAAAIDAAPRSLFGGGTSISGAIDFAADQFRRCPFPAERRTIDISGDGVNNRGRPADLARDAAVAAGLVINGLPILALEPWLDGYYRDHVIGGDGSFLIAAATFEEFARAIRRKLITEIAGSPVWSG
jgi:hypothetical protein